MICSIYALDSGAAAKKVGEVTLVDGRLSMTYVPGYQTMMTTLVDEENLLGSSSYEAQADPEGWFKALPYKYQGSYMWAEMEEPLPSITGAEGRWSIDDDWEQGFSSPVEERHIDFMLEEEFSVSPEFLQFFLKAATEHAVSGSTLTAHGSALHCDAFRSVTTEAGETDVLVRYGAKGAGLPYAILIENKVRAVFQPDQADRYRARGEAGKGKYWSAYFTCLVAHRRYAPKNHGFDSVVYLDELAEFFSREQDARSAFRAKLLQRVIAKFESTGLQRLDENVTRFRANFAQQFQSHFSAQDWWTTPPRAAWWGDTWITCRRRTWPKGVELVYMANTAGVRLVLPLRNLGLLERIVRNFRGSSSDMQADTVSVTEVGKSKCALLIGVPCLEITGAESPNFAEVFQKIELLDKLYQGSAELLPPQLRPTGR